MRDLENKSIDKVKNEAFRAVRVCNDKDALIKAIDELIKKKVVKLETK